MKIICYLAYPKDGNSSQARFEGLEGITIAKSNDLLYLAEYVIPDIRQVNISSIDDITITTPLKLPNLSNGGNNFGLVLNSIDNCLYLTARSDIYRIYMSTWTYVLYAGYPCRFFTDVILNILYYIFSL